MRSWRAALVGTMVALAAAGARAAEPPALINARGLYNAADYDAAIAAAADARRIPEAADAAAVVQARAYLERFRATRGASDLSAAHEALSFASKRAAVLAPRDNLDLLVGLGQYLFFSDDFGPATQFFDTALSQAFLLNDRERLLLLDWWANALDRSAQARVPEARGGLFARLAERMQEELRRDPASPVANYWLPVAARGQSDLEGAWDLAKTGWVRSALAPETAYMLRQDLDRFVTEAVVPELARARNAPGTLREEWESLKQQWP